MNLPSDKIEEARQAFLNVEPPLDELYRAALEVRSAVVEQVRQMARNRARTAQDAKSYLNPDQPL